MSIASKLAELVIKKGGTLSADEDSVEEILAKLIELEDGGGGGGGTGSGLVIHMIDPNEDGNWIMDKTWQEIYDAVSAGGSAVVLNPYEESGTTYVMAGPVTFVGQNRYGDHYVTFFFEYNSSKPSIWLADSADGYPHEAIE